MILSDFSRPSSNLCNDSDTMCARMLDPPFTDAMESAMNRRIALLGISILLCVCLSPAQVPKDVSTLIKDINPGAGSSNPQSFTDVNGASFFSAYDVMTGNELWKSDGTLAGTVPVKDINLSRLMCNEPYCYSDGAVVRWYSVLQKQKADPPCIESEPA